MSSVYFLGSFLFSFGEKFGLSRFKVAAVTDKSKRGLLYMYLLQPFDHKFKYPNSVSERGPCRLARELKKNLPFFPKELNSFYT